jgi:hypothetical protein
MTSRELRVIQDFETSLMRSICQKEKAKPKAEKEIAASKPVGGRWQYNKTGRSLSGDGGAVRMVKGSRRSE